MNERYLDFLRSETQALKESGLYKSERIITSKQGAIIETLDESQVINLSANNYLGLANHPDIIKAAHDALNQYGYGMSSVRFISGTQVIHKTLERDLSQYLNMEDTILFSSCFDANTGLFEALLNEQDAILSDSLNHASIIDGIRLCKASRFLYSNNDMNDLEKKLQETQSYRFRLIATDGVFSMSGTFAHLKVITDLASRYNAFVMVDDSHGVGVIGQNGRGTPEYFGVSDKIDILTGTLGKALGGASGGYISSKKEVVEWLRQRARPYLFSNTLAPVIAATSIQVLSLLKKEDSFRKILMQNTEYFQKSLKALGFQILEGRHPIIPVMLGDAHLATEMADNLLKEGIYVISFSYPVVPMNEARIRTQISAAHTKEQLDRALQSFEKVGKQLRIIP